ncbi:MAG: hypothetical protein IJB79_02580 [Candidatus Gastranaerophilales bacterium]|nr:hypothetical protein [Candidatus Gastranaerophilales bacterium]
MKKIILATTLILFSLTSQKAFCEIEPLEFIQKFSTCSYFIDNNERKIQAILGWSNRRCYYKELNYKGELTCSFKQLELNEVVKTMKQENFDYTKGIDSLEAIRKYLDSPEHCIRK